MQVLSGDRENMTIIHILFLAPSNMTLLRVDTIEKMMKVSGIVCFPLAVIIGAIQLGRRFKSRRKIWTRVPPRLSVFF